MQFTRVQLLVVAALAVLAYVVSQKLLPRREGLSTTPIPTGIVVTGGPREQAQRIAGGMKALQGRYPWIVRTFNKGKPWCTGFLISPRHVLTASHCVAKNTSADEIKVRIGGNKSDGSDGEPRACKAFIRGPWVRGEKGAEDHDWALLTLYTPSTKMPIKLDGVEPTGHLRLKKGMNVWVAGFGEGWYDRKPEDLRIVEVVLNGVMPRQLRTANNLDGEWRTPCHGDSGGPLFIRGAARDGSQDIAIGIVSRSSGKRKVSGDCNPGDPAELYTRVSAVMDTLRNMKK